MSVMGEIEMSEAGPSSECMFLPPKLLSLHKANISSSQLP